MAKRKQRRRNVNGILILDKPVGLSSNKALQTVKRLFSAQKAGHTGSLDPLATGVLPLCFGEATKFSQFLLNADKHYVATVDLGVTTTTGDAEGEILERKSVPTFSSHEIEEALDQFRGDIEQIPSMYSAIKVNGQPLYKLARQGITIERKSRQVTVFDLSLCRNLGKQLVLKIHSSKGTYVRTLAEDLGKVLGCGAHISGLRRTASGPFTIEQAITLEELAEVDQGQSLDALLLSPAAAVAEWPMVELTETSASYLMQGQPVQIAKAPTQGWVRIFSIAADSSGDNFIGVGEIIDDGRVAPRRLVVTR